MEGRQRYQRTLTYDPAEYPTEKDVRRALELTVSQFNAGSGAAKADAKFMDICALYRREHLREHLPTLEYSTRYTNGYALTRYIEAEFGHPMLPAPGVLVDSNGAWLRQTIT
jgi:hypothetical protein